MKTQFGIALDTWVTIDRDCDMTHEVVAEQAQITLGHPTGTLQLILDESGLSKLLEIAHQTLGELRATTRT